MVGLQSSNESVGALSHGGDRFGAGRLDPAVCGEDDQATTVSTGGGVQQCNAAAIGVAHHERSFDRHCSKQVGKYSRLDVQPIGRPGPIWYRRRCSMTGSFERHDRRAGRFGDLGWCVPPLRERTESVVQHHNADRPIAPPRRSKASPSHVNGLKLSGGHGEHPEGLQADVVVVDGLGVHAARGGSDPSGHFANPERRLHQRSNMLLLGLGR